MGQKSRIPALGAIALVLPCNG